MLSTPLSSNSRTDSQSSSSSCSSCYSSPFKRRQCEMVQQLHETCPNYNRCEGLLQVWKKEKDLYDPEVFVMCSSRNKECRYMVRIASFNTSCLCGRAIVKGNLITRHSESDKWVHMTCRNAESVDGSAPICAVCLEVIEDDASTMPVNIGGKRGVKHLECAVKAQSEYVVDLCADLHHETVFEMEKEDNADGVVDKLDLLRNALSRGKKRNASEMAFSSRAPRLVSGNK